MPLPANVKNKKQGDIIRSEDWNVVTNEVERLDTAKSNLAGAMFTGPLAIRSDSNNAVDGSHLRLIETQANDFARLGFHNSNVPTQAWHIAGLISAVAGTPSRLNFWHNQKGDVLSLVNDGRVEILGGNWDVTNSEGDLKIGNNAHRLKIGIALGGGGAGDVRIRAVGGTNRMILGGGTNDTLIIGQDRMDIAINSRMYFGSQTRQMLNLFGESYGIGVQNGTHYFRTVNQFGWYVGGSHTNNSLDPGTNGTRLMNLDQNGTLHIKGNLVVRGADLILSGRTNPSGGTGSSCRALVDWGNQLHINFGSDFTNGVVINGPFYSPNLPLGDRGNAQYEANTGRFFYDNSSRRYKINIAPLEDDFKKILRLQPRTYSREQSPEVFEIGYIAEEFESLGLNRLIYYNNDGLPDGLNYNKICMYILEILREHEVKLNPKSPYLDRYMESDEKNASAKTVTRTKLKK